MKSTQLAYPTAQFFQGETPSRPPETDKPSPENLPKLKLLASQKPEGRQLHHMRDGCVVLYKRDRSDVWQVRFKLFDMKWHCYSTKHKDLEYARRVASNLYDRSRFAEEMGMPLVAKTFVVVAQACLKQLELEIEQGIKPRSASDYQRVIRKYLIALVFTILGLAIQTAKFGTNDLGDAFELAGWLCLMGSGITSLLRMELLPVAQLELHKKQNFEEELNRIQQLLLHQQPFFQDQALYDQSR